MMYGEAIWFSGKRIATVLNSLRNNIRRESGYGTIKRTLLKEFPLHNRDGWVTGIRDRGVNCLSKSVTISPLRVRDLKEKVMG